MKLTVAILLICLGASASFAFEIKNPFKTPKTSLKTNDMFAPRLEQFEVFLGASIPYGNTDSTPLGQKRETSGYIASGSLAYGLLDWLAIYGSQTYQSYDYTYSNPRSTAKVTGFGNSIFGAKGIMNFDGPFAYYDASYSIGLADKSKLSSTDRAETAIARRPDLKLQAGAGLPIEMFSGGFLITGHLYQEGERTTSTTGFNDTTTKYNAGTGLDWKIYAQIEKGWKLGLSYDEKKTHSFTTVTNGFSSNNAEVTLSAITVYGILPLFDMFELIGSAAKIDNKEAVNTTYNLYDMNVALRWAF